MKATKIVEFINIKGNEKPIEFIVHKTHRGYLFHYKTYYYRILL